ncbi:hypothetical protein GCM10010430_59310 [Kitasatospora cystarginea]|uniref:Metallo-beta-lactamase domain-containing protein n=1 Tax=Kitasatospora cystarginea TaxID=58350 RepID=A0ABN3EPZ4_9ACTN
MVSADDRSAPAPLGAAPAAGPQVGVRAAGGPTAVLELGGLRLLTDPTFDAPGAYTSPSGSVLTKTAGPGLRPKELGRIDAVLLSHDQHADNLDEGGRALLPTVPVVVTTPDGAARLGGNAHPLAPWAHVDLQRPGGATPLRVTGVPPACSHHAGADSAEAGRAASAGRPPRLRLCPRRTSRRAGSHPPRSGDRADPTHLRNRP